MIVYYFILKCIIEPIKIICIFNEIFSLLVLFHASLNVRILNFLLDAFKILQKLQGYSIKTSPFDLRMLKNML